MTLAAFPLKAQQPAADTDVKSDAPADVVEVSAVKDPEWRSYRVMLKALDAFDKNHAMAPDAKPDFIVAIKRAGIKMSDVKLKILGEETALQIAIAEDGTFILPREQKAVDEDAMMVVNQKKNDLRWHPYIRSPGVPAGMRRLGDVRLECEMLWAVEQDGMPFISRNTFRLLGGPCHSSKIQYFSAAAKPIVSAQLNEGGESLKLLVGRNRVSFAPPLYDKKWSDDALISFQYAEETPPN
jgi:hypothetical protein